MLAFTVAVTVLMLCGSTEAQTPKKCCLPQESSVILTDLNTVAGENMGQMDAQFDWNRQLQATVNYTIDLSTGKMNIVSKQVIDFKNKVMFYMPGNDSSKCYKVPYDVEGMQCVPDDAQYLGTSYMGPLLSPLTYDGWRFTMKPNLEITIALTRKDCIPLLENVKIPGPPASNTMLWFNQFQPKLINPDAFVLPPSCKQL
jgi:hypothetical protein